MLKIVPDPPQQDKYTTHTLEDLLVQISEYLVCALTVSQQTVLLHSKPPGQVLTLAAMHEIDSARTLVEVALSRVQSRH
ncbi:hypothetical protein [Pseudomonas mosselii]|uniref:hypothetical protein n=1 Tax=Pseudomonas mosselii TaxID=78327 RepID=UPI0021D8BBA6|nr:hypothetical protein [Pseudomonas mosselii]MCU9532833.1 hypothetical protein [Pseudomonas mosselii]MCU9540239.1 hypothetical protein [Pseudomonas mosselii]MCU9545947.1 hypothetical protein [Pseudomonas mosselii]MCU9551807.1 hypothetical protein [Pseudomonas mosselii]